LKVLAVVPTLGRDVDRLNRAIQSLRAHSGACESQILVVNNSGLPSIAGLDDVDHVYSPGVNLGYVGALEAARRRFPCEFLWSIQDDMTLANDVLAALLAAMSRSDRLGVMSPVLVRSGVVPARTRAGVFTNPERTRWENHPPVDTPPAQLPADVEYSFVSGSGALFRSEALADIGGFDLDLYPLMHVDVDVCARLIANGWEIRLDPQAHIDHQIQGSTPGILGRTLDRRNRPVVEARLEGRGPCDAHGFDPVDPDVLLSVARRASFLFLDVSREAEDRLEEINSALTEARQRVESLAAQLNDCLAEREHLIEQRDWWHGQFRRLRQRRSVRWVLAVVGVVSELRTWSVRGSPEANS
jgi:GT2 family glycosyltransferase